MYLNLKSSVHSFLLMLAFLLANSVLFPLDAEAGSEGSYYRVDFTDLSYENGSYAKVREAYSANKDSDLLRTSVDRSPIINIAGGGEYFPINTDYSYETFWTRLEFVIRVPGPSGVKGTIVWNVGNDQVKTLRFELEPTDATPGLSDLFWQKRAEYYQALMNRTRSNAGSAWFRYQYRQSIDHLPDSPASNNLRRQLLDRQRFRNQRNNQLTFALATGGRAISENLQLHDPLFVREDQGSAVPIDSLEGITIREYDWEELTRDLDPERDRLADAIPHDQHGVFFRNFQGLLDVADQLKSQGRYFVMLANSGAQDAESQQFYEGQLCLSLDNATRILGSKMVASVALTGGDLYLRTGTDIALVLEPTEIGKTTLLPLLATQISARASGMPDAKAVSGSIGDVTYNGYVSEGREISTYWAPIEGNVVITNSVAQLERLVAVANKEVPALADLDEFTFFRDRYSVKDQSETAFVFISDATIRRWCGPKWRIASARRTRAVAKMAEAQAASMDALVKGTVTSGPLESSVDQIDAGQLVLTPAGVRSKRYGTLLFQTPIAEMDITKISKAEADGYRQWRAGYQSRWRNFFDPIGIQISLRDGVFESDVTVMPLIAGSDYADLIDLSQGTSLSAGSGDPHAEAILHFVLSLNHESDMLRQLNGVAGNFAPGLQVDIFSWIGESVAFYVDKSSFWDEWLEVAESDYEGRGIDSRDAVEFLQANLNRVPVAVRIEVASGFRLGLFLTALKGFAESAAPGLLRWETLTHKEQPYVSIASPMLASEDEFPDDLRLYYLATGKQLLFTLNEAMITQAIDREIARAAGQEPPGDKVERLGNNMNIKMTEQMTRLYLPLIEDASSRDMQQLSWANLPILNEWKNRYPDKDPIEVHREFWQRTLLCPGGGQYVWNAEIQQMESTVYGSPGNPKMPAKTPLPKLLRNLKGGEFGVSFEDDGLRARVLLELE